MDDARSLQCTQQGRDRASSIAGCESGRVTLVEFVDYECPHCRHAQELLKQIIEAYPNDVRVVFKHFPLSGHSNARLAAEAAMAAHRQGRFWPYSDKVWDNSDHLTVAVLDKIAKEVGLDLERWRADRQSDAVKDRVQRDRDEGVALRINATPSLYVNGRKYTDPLEISSLSSWVDDELGR